MGETRPAARAHLYANAAAFFAASFFGASVVAVRVAVRDIPPLSLGWLRFGQGAVVLLAVLAIWSPGRLRVAGRQLVYLALLGGIFFAAFPFTFNTGMQFTEASRGALLLASMPIWSAWLARRIVRERLTPSQLTGVVLTIVGVAFVLAERGLDVAGGARALLGDVLLLATALLGAVYGVLAPRALSRHHPIAVTAYAMLFGTALLTAGAIPEGLVEFLPRLDDPALLGLVVFLGIPGGAVGFALWTAALSRLSPTQVAVYVNVNPLVASVMGALLLDERLTPLFLAGFVAVAGGVFMVNRRRAPVSTPQHRSRA